MSKGLKRKRVDTQDSAPKKSKTVQLHKKSITKRSAVHRDALQWKEAALPDRLDDAEGFYGLEELDDVEVVKDEETGLTTFRPSNADIVLEEASPEQQEIWSGFDEEAADTSKPEIDKLNANKKGNLSSLSSAVSHPLATKKSAKKDSSKVSKVPSIAEDIGFAALEDDGEQSGADITAWKELDLSVDILSALSTLGFSDPTPIQKAAIPPVLEGRDVIGKAVTGSGKTLAFGIPIVERWMSERQNSGNQVSSFPIAFILAPTRELAHQLAKHLTALCAGLEHGPRIATVTGGLSVIKQQRQLETADIIIGTPGRLWEVINSSHGLIERLRQAQFLVIDEADRLLSEGHFKEVEEILDVLNRKIVDEDEEGNSKVSVSKQRQTLVFSATFHKGLQQKLASKQKWRPDENSELLTNNQSLEYLLKKLKFQRGTKPTFVDTNPTSQMAENLTESILECGAMQKDLYLYSLLLLQQHEHQKTLRTKPTSNKITRTLVFTNSISTVKRLVPLLFALSLPYTAVLPLHSSMPQKSRLRSLERFTSPPDSQITTSILISTDVAARGLDIKGIDTIIHYHVPRAADTYVHRSGRTARGSDNTGRSILICSPEEVAGVTRLVSKIHADKSSASSTSSKLTSKQANSAAIKPFYLPASLHSQLSHRVGLAQRITASQIDTSKSKSEDNWLRTAADELGVDYSSEDFEAVTSRVRRGRGGGRDKKKKENVENASKGKVLGWKSELREEMKDRKVDFGDGEGVRTGRYLAGGSVDVEALLRERDGSSVAAPPAVTAGSRSKGVETLTV